MMDAGDDQQFTEEEIADLLKSKDNLAYLFQLNGEISRISCTSETNVHDAVF